MYFIIPEDMNRLERIFEPYTDGTELREDAPDEARKAYEEFYKWFGEKMSEKE